MPIPPNLLTYTRRISWHFTWQSLPFFILYNPRIIVRSVFFSSFHSPPISLLPVHPLIYYTNIILSFHTISYLRHSSLPPMIYHSYAELMIYKRITYVRPTIHHCPSPCNVASHLLILHSSPIRPSLHSLPSHTTTCRVPSLIDSCLLSCTNRLHAPHSLLHAPPLPKRLPLR